jgi:pimeloyl-ACP methyl ester carboxylesterase
MSDGNGGSGSTLTNFRSPDGLFLKGTYHSPGAPPAAGLVLVHGGGVTREEGGFFTRMAAGLADRGVASLRFDLRGHGESGGRQEDLTLSGILNDIHAATTHHGTSPAPGETAGADQSARQLQKALHRRQAVLVG